MKRCIGAIIWVLSGCGSTPAAHLQLTHISPSMAAAYTGVQVTLTGTFTVAVHVSFTEPHATDVNNQYSASIGDESLRQVRYVNAQTLTAYVPASLGLGVHDVNVTGPDGVQVTLPHGFMALPQLGGH